MQAHSQDFQRGVTWVSVVHVCMHKHARLGGLGACAPKKFFEIRCPKIASEAFFGQKQSCGTYMVQGILHPVFMPVHMYGHFLSQLTLNFHEKR